MNGVGSVTTGVDGIPITEISNSCEFCNLILESPSGRRACIDSWKKLAHTARGDPRFFRCHAGFQYARGRIELHNELVAIQVAGQFLNSLEDEEKFAANLQDLSERHNIDIEELSAAARSIRILNEDRQIQTGGWLKKIAQTFEIIAHERAELLGRLKSIAAMSTFDG
jgi:ligand-binding sensor protein